MEKSEAEIVMFVQVHFEMNSYITEKLEENQLIKLPYQFSERLL